MMEKTVNRGLHGISLGSIVAAIAVLLANPQRAESILWYMNHKTEVHQNINVVPQLQSAVTEMKIRMDKMDHEKDSLIDLIQSLQRGVQVLATGKVPYDSVKVRNRFFHKDTPWLWRARE